jgi:phage baseplate assembly protein W
MNAPLGRNPLGGGLSGSSPRYRAWRFRYPDIDAPEMVAGLSVSARGGAEMVQDDESVRQAILLLISTIPGERVMRPEYGCPLNRLVFSPNDDTTAGLAILYVRRAIQQWEPRVEILYLDARRNEDMPERLDISLEYRVQATQRTAQLNLALNLSGER